MKKLLFIVAFVLVVIAIVLGGWQLKKPTSLNVTIVDRTVPTDDYAEHAGLTWLLGAQKYVKEDDTKYTLQDYVGYHPEKKQPIEKLPTNYDDTDVVYLADTYGVYEENETGDKPKKIDGGLTIEEWNAMFKRLDRDKPVTLITEFNTLAIPTDDKVRAHMSSVLGVQPSGWIGRYFTDLSFDNPDVPQWLKNQYKDKKWPYSGKGYLIVNEQQEKSFVLDEKDVDGTLTLSFTDAGKEQFGLTDSVPYRKWFEIVEEESSKNVLAYYDWDVQSSGKKKLRKYGVPEKFVAIHKMTMNQATAYYFGGDFNVSPSLPNYYQGLGIPTMHKWISHFSKENGFYWDTYMPVMNNILAEAKANQKKVVAKKEKPKDVQYPSRIEGTDMQVKVDGKWQTMKIQGVNLGMGKPGYFPGQAAITEDEYFEWFDDIGKLGSNTIRVYTVQPPGFYNALKRYNEQAKHPLYVLHGTWIEEERIVEKGNVYDKKATEAFQQEIRHIVDIIHGNEMIPYKAGHATGAYTTDVSEYVIGWIIGIEWDPEMVVSTNKKNKKVGDYDGTYVYSKDASPFEHWIAEQLDYTATYEKEQYNWIRPLSFTNWVTTDLLDHPEEPDSKEDLVSIDPNKIHLKGDYKKTSQFASYHVYPYYPESLNYQYNDYVDFRGEKNNYAAYLKDLHAAHDMPILIAEFGIPASRGKTHENVNGWNQGHMSEKAQGETLARLYEDILHEDLMGGLVFTWQDEWFKRTWNTMDLDNPDRRPYWSNAQTSEQQFGLVSFDTLKIKVDGDDSDWKQSKTIYKTKKGPIRSLMMDHDERYVYYKIQMATDAKGYPMLMLDTKQSAGNTTVNDYDLKTTNALEFIAPLQSKDDARMLVDTQYDIYALYYEKYDRENIHYDAQQNSGNFTPIHYVLSNTLKIPTTKQVIPFHGYETGKFLEGNANPESRYYNSLVDFNMNEKEHFIELRVPWMLMSFADPSLKEVVGAIGPNDYEAREKVEGIQVGVAFINESGEVQTTLPAKQGNVVGKFKQYTWDNWEIPQHQYRLKQSYDIVQKVFMKNDAAFIE